MGEGGEPRTVRRRTLLAAVPGLVLAGCSTDEGPTETPTAADYVGRFDRALRAGEAEFAEVRIRVTDGVARLTYETTAPSGADRSAVRDAIERETHAVASAFAAVVGAGWSVHRLTVTVEQSDTVVVTYHVERAWAEDFNGPNRSSVRYGRRIAATVERHGPATPTGTGETPGGRTSTPSNEP